MPLNFKEPPKEFREAFAKGLTEGARIYRRHKPDHPMGGEFSPDRTERPLEIFSITVTALRSGAGLPDATSEGWRAFLQERQPLRTVDVVRSDEGLVFLGISTGPQDDYTRTLLDEMCVASEFEADDFIPRLFRVKPLNLAALWLASEDPRKDMLIPLPPVSKPFVEGQQYGAKEFDRLLKDAANAKAPNSQVFFATNK
jgi:hypothetical protein